MNLKRLLAIRTGFLLMAGILFGGQSVHAAPDDACALVTTAEIQTAFGTSFAPAKALGAKRCQWREDLKPGHAAFLVDVAIDSLHFYEVQKSTPGSATYKPVSGLGDDAFFALWKAGTSTSESLWVKKGDAAFNVRIWGTKPISDADREAKERAIAADILKRI